MDMRVNRYGQWREDIRDLSGLTVMKMDKYLILNTLMLGFTIVLWCEGRLDIQDHQWLLWLYMLCLGGSFVFLLLSIWLSIHASVVAQSFMVRLLTQHVRLPVPLQEEVSAARPYSNKFEKGKAREFFRIPVLHAKNDAKPKEETATTGGTAGLTSSPGNVATGSSADARGRGSSSSDLPPRPASSPNVSTTTPHPATAPSAHHHRGPKTNSKKLNDGLYRSEVPEQFQEENVTELPHIVLYRELQRNWIGYDAYCRISMSFGVNQLLQALGYYCLGYVLIQDNATIAAWCCLVMFNWISMLIVKIDMCLTQREQIKVFSLLMVGSGAAATAATLEYYGFDQHHHLITHLLRPIMFGGHFMWLCFFYNKACASNAADLALPKHFRAILYLDVFGGFERTLTGGARRVARSTLSSIVDGVQNLQQFNPLSFRAFGTLETARARSANSVAGQNPNQAAGIQVGSISERSTPLLEEQHPLEEERVTEAADSTGASGGTTTRRESSQIRNLSTNDVNTDVVTPIQRSLLQANRIGQQAERFITSCQEPRIRSYMSPYDRQQASTAQQEFNELQVELRELTAQANSRGWLNGNLPAQADEQDDIRESTWLRINVEGDFGSETPYFYNTLTHEIQYDPPENFVTRGTEFCGQSVYEFSQTIQRLREHMNQRFQTANSIAIEVQDTEGRPSTVTVDRDGHTFFPAQPHQERQTTSFSPGVLPWRMFRRAALVILGSWFCGFVWSLLVLIFGHDASINDLLLSPFSLVSSDSDTFSSLLSTASAELMPMAWPNAWFRPDQVACAHDEIIFSDGFSHVKYNITFDIMGEQVWFASQVAAIDYFCTQSQCGLVSVNKETNDISITQEIQRSLEENHFEWPRQARINAVAAVSTSEIFLAQSDGTITFAKISHDHSDELPGDQNVLRPMYDIRRPTAVMRGHNFGDRNLDKHNSYDDISLTMVRDTMLVILMRAEGLIHVWNYKSGNFIGEFNLFDGVFLSSRKQFDMKVVLSICESHNGLIGLVEDSHGSISVYKWKLPNL